MQDGQVQLSKRDVDNSSQARCGAYVSCLFNPVYSCCAVYRCGVAECGCWIGTYREPESLLSARMYSSFI